MISLLSKKLKINLFLTQFILGVVATTDGWIGNVVDDEETEQNIILQHPVLAQHHPQQLHPQAQVQQQNLGARGFVPPQNVHQMVFMTVRTGFLRILLGIRKY